MKSKKIGIVVFPGSNCDQDCHYVVSDLFGQEASYVWHKQTSLDSFDLIVLPGGFSYGDYLRCGAIARFSPVMKEVVKFARAGGLVLGICNGFQILIESGLLPGALMRNKGLNFICDEVTLRLERNDIAHVSKGEKGHLYRMPIAHMDGNYFIDSEGLKKLKDNNQIVFTYQGNPNGSVENIAGLCNEAGNVLGLMPHPERVSEDLLGGRDGRFIFESLLTSK